jgi:methyltransferase (TIGR00027 family)
MVGLVRSDDDTWDITTSVGSTALFVAAARALEARKPEPLAVDPYAEMFCRAVGGEWADVLDGKDSDNLLTTSFGTYFVDYQGARTRYFDAYFHAAVQDGVRQIVMLAAGLDSRAYRLTWPPGTVVYELDQPQVLDFKREVLAQHGHTPAAERREVPVDLRGNWPQALIDKGFDPASPSAWIAEGLLIYLPATAQEQLFSGIDRLATLGSHVAVEELAPLPAAAFEAKRDEAQGVGNTFFTLVFNEQHAPAEHWFSAHGWSAAATPLADWLRRVGRLIPEGESDARYMVDSVSLVSATKR